MTDVFGICLFMFWLGFLVLLQRHSEFTIHRNRRFAILFHPWNKSHLKRENQWRIFGLCFGEDDLLPKSEIQDSSLINHLRIDTMKIFHARQYHCNQTLKKINHLSPAESNLETHDLAFAELKPCNRLLCEASLRLLAGHKAEVADDLLKALGLKIQLLAHAADANIHHDLFECLTDQLFAIVWFMLCHSLIKSLRIFCRCGLFCRPRYDGRRGSPFCSLCKRVGRSRCALAGV